MRLSRVLVPLVASAALIAAGCGGDETSIPAAGGTTTAPTSTAAPTDTTGTQPAITECQDSGQPAAGDKPQFSKPEQVLKNSVDYTVVMSTSCGVINIVLDQKAGGPIPNAIAFLASKGFYDGLTFHRVVPDFVLQGGDPAGNGSGGPGFDVVGPVPEGYQYKKGDVAMAKTSVAPPGSSGSQFFVVSGTQGEQILTSQPVYGILGHATDPASLATIDRIAALAVTDGPPSKPVWIISAKLVEGAVS